MSELELLPYGVIASFKNKLKSSSCRELTEKMESLLSNIEYMETLLLGADDHQEEDVIQHLIRMLKDAVQAADDFFDDIATQKLRHKSHFDLFCRLISIVFQRGNNKKLEKIEKNFCDLRNDPNWHRLKPRSSESDRRLTTSNLELEILFRDEDRLAISKMLVKPEESQRNENVSLVGIVGDGGIGKTAVAQLVYNSEEVNEFFDVKAWVYVSENVSENFVVANIIKQNLSSLDFEINSQESFMERVLKDRRLFIDAFERVLKDRKYLLVLDDVRVESYEKWAQLMTPFKYRAQGSKILVTTRSKIVANAIGDNNLYPLQALDLGHSFSLLGKLLFENNPFQTDLQSVGKQIVTKCEGVPRLIRTVAKMLHGKFEEREWLEVLEGDFLKQGHVKYYIMQDLKLSFQHLSPEVKQCCVHCLMYPKGWEIEKKELIQLWMAQGFLEGLDDEGEMEDVGEEFLSTLLRFGVDNQDSFKMHDLIYDLALVVAGNNYSLGSERTNAPIHTCLSQEFNNTNLLGFLGARELLANFLQHMCFSQESNYTNLSDSLDARKLRTIFLRQAKDGKITQIPSELPFILRFKRLRSLNLSHSSLMKLSCLIGELEHLRYLDLSWCVKLQSLPQSIGNLVNLQTLKLTGCEKLQFSTKIVTKLISLRHLEIDRCKAFKDMMPAGLGRLSSLQSLSNFYVMDEKKAGVLNELKDLNSLRGNLEINILDQVSNVKESEKVNLKQKNLLDSLDLNWENRNDKEKSFQLLENLCPHHHLKRLQVKWYPGDRFSTWLSSRKNLSHISFFGFDNCKSLPPLENLENLKSLEISSMKVLECIYLEEGFNAAASFFPSLESLKFSGCQNFRGWKKMKDQVNVDNLSLPQLYRLSQLIINKCPYLTDLPTFPNVEELQLCQSAMKPLEETLDITSSSSSTPLSKLKSLKIEGKLPNIKWKKNLPYLEHLEIGDADKPDIWFEGNFPALQKVVVYGCDLKALPSKICDVLSLQHIKMMGCHKLASLPKEMVKLTELVTIEILDCPLLVERCQEETGADWPQIKHVKKIIFKENLRR